jgi:hypothetical protein
MLPTIVLAKIAQFLPSPKDVVTMSLVCKTWKDAIPPSELNRYRHPKAPNYTWGLSQNDVIVIYDRFSVEQQTIQVQVQFPSNIRLNDRLLSPNIKIIAPYNMTHKVFKSMLSHIFSICGEWKQ